MKSKRELRAPIVITFLGVFIFIGLLSYGAAHAAETGRIEGVVKDAGTGMTLPGALVEAQRIVEGGGETKKFVQMTDVDGKFRILMVPAGDYNVVVTFMGYRPGIVLAPVAPGISTEITVALVTTIIKDIEIYKYGSEVVQILRDESAAIDVIDDSFIEDMPIRGRSYQSIMEILPGVVSGADGETHVRGGREGEVGWIIDGHVTNDPATNTFGTNLNMNSIEKMEVITGGFSAEYGNYMSGIVNVVTKSGSDKFHGTLDLYIQDDSLDKKRGDESYRSIDPGITLEGPIVKGKLTFFISADYSDYEVQFPGYQGPITWNGFNTYSKFSWTVTPDDTLKFSYLRSYAYIDFATLDYPKDDYYDQEQNTNGFAVDWKKAMDGGNYLFILAADYYNIDIYFGSVDDPTDLTLLKRASVYGTDGDQIWAELGLEDPHAEPGYLGTEYINIDGAYRVWQMGTREWYSFSTRFMITKFDDHFIKIGLGVSQIDFTMRYADAGQDWYVYMSGLGWLGDNPFDYEEGEPYYHLDPFDTTIAVKTTSMDGFVQESWSIYDSLTLNAGVRWDYFEINEANNISPRLGLAYSPSSRCKYFLSYGHFYNRMSVYNHIFSSSERSFTEKYYDSDVYEIAYEVPEKLKNEKTIATEIGTEQQVTDNMTFTLTTTYKEFYDMLGEIDVSPASSISGGVRQMKNLGHGNYWGIEAKFKKRLSHNFSGRLSYTYSEATGTESGEHANFSDSSIPIPQEGVEVYLDWDRRHIAKLSFSYELPWDLTFNGIYSYASGLPWTPFSNSWLRDSEGHLRIETRYEKDRRNTERIPPNQTFDLSVIKSITISGRYKFTVRVDGFNLFNYYNVYRRYGNASDYQDWYIGIGRRMQIGMSFKF